MMSETIQLSKYQNVLQQLLEKSAVLSLAVINEQQEPEASLVPFLYDSDCFWVFVSQLSGHTQHLLKAPNVSVLIFNTEEKMKNPFAIQRVSASCQVSIERERRDEILDRMTQKLGETVSLLRQLGDFHLFKLAPNNGRLIAGFGQAFDIDFTAMTLEHIGKPENG